MKSLPRELRDQLAKTTEKARTQAEEAVRAAIENLAVHEKDYRPHMSVEQRQLRNRLRARGRALGDDRDTRSGVQEITRLVEAAAYEHWHRLLFTRFLAGNDLLFTDAENGNVAVTLEECEELAAELGAKDGFELACRFSSETLPGVFRRDDPVLELALAANHTIALRKLVESLPDEVFRAQDALGWTYQFWQTKRKKEVNDSGSKIGAAELSPVTQLFTEDYMVEFLLHNTLGAWWAGRQAAVSSSKFHVSRSPTEEDARRAASLPPKDGLPGIDWTYLRFISSETEGPELETSNLKPETPARWIPAAGTFDGWPTAAKDITSLDPCMGSGHFPVFALPILARLRMEEEDLSAREAVAAVLRENIHGLELDPRCCQIGAFNLALTAWKLGGHQVLPPLQIACCGIAPQGKKEEWIALTGKSDRLRRGMERLFELFKQAPVLGSLINPRIGGGDLLEADFHELQPLLEKAMEVESKDETQHEMVVAARGIAKAAEIMAGKFTLVSTNVPYLGRGKQDEVILDYCEQFHPDAKADLATCFVERCLDFCAPGASSSLVTPQNWLFLGTYKVMRLHLLTAAQLNIAVRLGENGFESPQAAGAFTAMFCVTKTPPAKSHWFGGLDVGEENSPQGKNLGVRNQPVSSLMQQRQQQNPDGRITFQVARSGKQLSDYASSFVGLQNGDSPRFIMAFWEVPRFTSPWAPFQLPCDETLHFGGRQGVLKWDGGRGELSEFEGCYIKGREAWGKKGVAIRHMRELPATLYSGDLYDQNSAAIIPKNEIHLPAIWSFCSSPNFNLEVRKVDKAIKVTNATLVKIPFDLAHWQKVAAEKYPNGLPKPHSDDPTQWLFNGHPKGSDSPLQVAVARLLAYQWPRQTGSSFPDCPALTEPDGLEGFADNDGIVCLSALHRELPAAARLRKLLSAALGAYDERALIQATGSTKANLEDWLRDDFFKQHVSLFHNRPFVWHLWDGLKDGFHVLVNYHRLDHATLNALTYTYLGDWIREQKAAAADDVPGAAERLKSATHLQGRLAAILEGEAPLDLFVRWKPLSQQAIGWHPDLNDGIRLNIRPFLLAGDLGAKGAGLFRAKPGITLDPDKADRGTEPLRDKDEYPWFWCDKPPGKDPFPGKEYSGRRWNGVHLTLERKRGAKEKQ